MNLRFCLGVCMCVSVCGSVEQYTLMCVRDINEASNPCIVHFPTAGLSGTATQHNEIKANLKHMSLNCLHTQLNSAWSVKMTDNCVCASKVFVEKGSGSLSLDLFVYVIWCIYKKLFADNSVHSSHCSCSQIYGGFFFTVTFRWKVFITSYSLCPECWNTEEGVGMKTESVFLLLVFYWCFTWKGKENRTRWSYHSWYGTNVFLPKCFCALFSSAIPPLYFYAAFTQ